MRHLLLAALLVAMTGCGPDTKQEVPAETSSENDQPSAEPPKVDVSVVNSIGMRFVPIPAGTFTMGVADFGKINDKTPVYTLTRRLISLPSLPRLQHSFRFCGSIQ